MRGLDFSNAAPERVTPQIGHRRFETNTIPAFGASPHPKPKRISPPESRRSRAGAKPGRDFFDFESRMLNRANRQFRGRRAGPRIKNLGR